MVEISFRDVTAATVRAICSLKVTDAQGHYVAPNAVSIAQAYFEPTADFRAVYAGETPVGFVMWRSTGEPAGTCYLWRYMIDADHQARGYGKTALTLLLEVLRERHFRHVRTSVVVGPASPLDFYGSLGFQPTGTCLPNGETELIRKL